MAKTDWTTKTITLEDGSVNNIIVKDGVLSAKHRLLFTPDNPLTQTVPPNTPIQIPLLEGTNTFFADSDVNLEVQYLKSDNATEEDTDLQTPTPNFPEEIESVGGEIMVSGKNLFDWENCDKLYGYIGTEEIVFDGSGSCYCVVIKCKPNTKYTISKRKSARFIICTTNERPVNKLKNYNHSSNSKASELPITTDENSKYIIVYYYHYSDTISEEEIRKSIMIAESDTAIPYEPYHEQTITIPKINKIGDAQDILHVDRASQRMWIERKCGEIGVEEFTESNILSGTRGCRFKYRGSNIKFQGSGLCDIVSYEPTRYSYSSEGTYVTPDENNVISLRLLDKITQAEFDEKFANIMVIYQLAEPEIEEVEYNEDLLTFYPTTVINTGVLPTTIKAKAKTYKQ